MNDKVVINNQGYLINNLTTNLNTGESSMELLNDDTTNFLTLTNIGPFGNTIYTYFYSSLIGNAENLAIGNVIYTDSVLTTTLAAGSYYQTGSTASTTFCTTSSDEGSVNINSSGAITAIFCAMP